MSTEEHSPWHLFALDAEEVLQDIEESLLALETDPRSQEEINRLYRGLHKLKGNSAVLELTQLEHLAHCAEDLTGLVRDHGVLLDAELCELMLVLVDCLKAEARAVGVRRSDADPELVQPLLVRAERFIAQRGLAQSLAVAPAPEGGFVIWSTPPSAPPAEAKVDELSTLEIFTALVREVVPSRDADLAALLERPSDAPARSRLLVTSAELRAAAERLDLTRVIQSLEGVEHVLREANDAEQIKSTEQALRAALADVAVRSPELMVPQAPPAMPAVATAEVHPQSRRPSKNVRAQTAPSTERADYLRVDARKIAQIMDLAGEIGLACGAVTRHPELTGQDLDGFSGAAHKLEVLIRELQNEVSAMRLVPVSGVFQNMRRVVRDAAKRTGKKVELELFGEDIEMDKVLVDRLHDPLVHVMRNAVDHGIEAPEDRVRAGKPDCGRLVLSATYQAGEVTIQVRDDGAGLSRDKILSRARQRNLVPPGAELDEQQIADLLFMPGFSTKEQVDELSGRGVGMDVVKTTIESLRGRVQLSSKAGEGTRLTMIVPLTLAFLDAMVVRSDEHLFVLPIEKVFEVFKAQASGIAKASADGAVMVKVRDQLVPVLWLHRYYGEACREERLDERILIVVQTSRGKLALPVDEILGNHQVMLKPLRGVLSGVRAAAGCGMLSTGDVAIALDCEQLRA